MALYHFIVHTSSRIDDPEGEAFPDDAAALAEGAQVASELKRDYGTESEDWAIEVLEGERLVALIPFRTVE
jgi:hypothetical protein